MLLSMFKSHKLQTRAFKYHVHPEQHISVESNDRYSIGQEVYTLILSTAAATSKAAAPATTPPRTELVLGRKWSIENHTGNRNLIIDQTDAKQSVYIFNCSNCTIQVCHM